MNAEINLTDDDLDELFRRLDDSCWACDKGKQIADGSECDICDGSGYITSYAGDRLLEFLARHRRRLATMADTQQPTSSVKG